MIPGTGYHTDNTEPLMGCSSSGRSTFVIVQPCEVASLAMSNRVCTTVLHTRYHITTTVEAL